MQELLLENKRLHEELNQFSNRWLSESRQRSGVMSRHPYEPVNQSQNYEGSRSAQDFRQLYGRDSENSARASGGSQDHSEDTKTRLCPKCQQFYPDLDTLQIHLMECLDNN